MCLCYLAYPSNATTTLFKTNSKCAGTLSMTQRFPKSESDTPGAIYDVTCLPAV